LPFDLAKINSAFATAGCAPGFGAEAFVNNMAQIRDCAREECDKKDLLENHVPKISIQFQNKADCKLIQPSERFV
jgi:hypothetical protein